MTSLKDKTVIITGGSGRLANFLARELNNLGVKIILVGRNEERLIKLVNELNTNQANATYFTCDLTKDLEVADLISSLNQQFNSVDIVINTVGSWFPGTLADHSEETINSIFGANIISLVIFTKHILPLVEKSKFGQILNLVSFSILQTDSFWPVYSAAKSSVQSFTKSIRAQFQNKKLRIMELYPDGMSWHETEKTIAYGKIAKIIINMLSQPSDLVIERVEVKKL